MKPVQRIVIRAEVFRQSGYASNRLLKHPTQALTVDNSRMNAKSNDATGVVIHHHEHPMRP